MRGKLKQSLTIEVILSKVSEYDIYRYYLGYDFIYGNKYPSPFRDERDGSFSIKEKSRGNLIHRDFGGDNKGNFVDFVMQLYPGLSFYDVLLKIDHDMRLGIVGGKEGYKDVVRGYKAQTPKKEKLLQVSTKPLDSHLLSYWRKRGLEKEDLKVDPSLEVFGVKYIRLNRIKIHIPESETAFAYLYQGKYWKVYRPEAQDPKFKWLSNVPLVQEYGLRNLSVDFNSIIMKAVKDYFVLLKIYPYVCGVQNESLEAFSEATVQNIKDNSKLVYYGGDNDAPGKKASYAITKAFDFKHVNVPDSYATIINSTFPKGVKDWDNWAEYEGLKKIEHYLKRKKII